MDESFTTKVKVPSFLFNQFMVVIGLERGCGGRDQIIASIRQMESEDGWMDGEEDVR